MLMADVVVGNGNNYNKSPTDGVKSPWRIIITFSVIVLILALGFFILMQRKTSSAFEIDGKYYSKSQIKGMSDYATKYGAEGGDAAKNIFEMYRIKTASQKTGIEPTIKDINSAKNDLKLPNYNKYSEDYIELAAYVSALEKSYLTYSFDKSSGYSFVFDFSKDMQEDNSVGPNYESDKQYAKNRAEYYYKQLKEKKITPDQLLVAIKKDNRIGRLPLSVRYGPNNNGGLKSQLFNNDIYNYVISQKKPGLSNIMVAEVQNSIGIENPKYRDGHYFFVLIETVGSKYANPSKTIQETMNAQKSSYFGVDKNAK